MAFVRAAQLLIGLSAVVGSREYAGDWIRVEAGAATCNVLDYGAKGNGVADDTKAVQSAITACAAGGTALLPSGYTYVGQGKQRYPRLDDRTSPMHVPLAGSLRLPSASLQVPPTLR